MTTLPAVPARHWTRTTWLCSSLLIGALPLASAQEAAAPESRAPIESNEVAEPADAGLRVTIFGRRKRAELGPLPGLNVSRDEIPANVQSLNAREIRKAGALGVSELMNKQLQSVSVNDYSGNPFQQDVNFRGFTAGPQVGTPQGLSVFFDGVRVNEPFGDVVNWDLLPLNAVERMDLFPGSNPLFGLNTLGGALSLRSKSGFSAPGLDLSVQAGSFGRKKADLAFGANDDGEFGAFVALSLIDEAGWRDHSPSRVGQLFARGDWQDDDDGHTLTASVLLADNNLIGNGMVPLDLFNQRPQSVFTSPDQSINRLAQYTFGGQYKIDNQFNLTAQVYRRKGQRRGVNGDIYEGFTDLGDLGGARTVNGRRLPQTLPICRYLDADANGVRDHTDPLNGPVGSGCSPVQYEQVAANGPRNGGRITQTGAIQAPTSGVIEGTPIGLLTRTGLEQSTDGVGVQLNGELKQHKLLIGAALDRNQADYRMSQQLGLIDAQHQVYLDSAAIAPEFGAAHTPITINAFDGNQRSASLYASDTWSPREDLHLTFAGRYNRTQVKTRLLARSANAELAEVGQLNDHLLCRDANDPASCDVAPQVYIPPSQRGLAPTAERFTYSAFNPAIGATWQATPEVNAFGNLSRGARVPSVIELGCAFDPTPVPLDPNNPQFGSAPRSLVGPTCSLPTALSGDPYLPQIRATSGELGLRGTTAGWDWNASVFRTDLANDLYFVGVGDGRSYFDTIGKTRRQGLELGLKGRSHGVDLGINYSYVSATFESPFYLVSPHNSSADFDQNSRSVTSDPGLLAGKVLLPSPTAGENRGFGTYHMTRVDPGARLPGIPLHTLNLSAAYKPVPTLNLGLTVQLRSSSFMRGNENNRHQAAGTDQEIGQYECNTPCTAGLNQLLTSPGRPFTQGGKVPAYAVFNLDARLEVDKGLNLTVQISNLFNRKYLTAGRLGVNPYVSGPVGASGASGWNYNSAEWQNASYVGPGAPRGIWVGLSYELGS